MNKNGFVSTSLIYTFFVILLLLMVLLISNYSSNRFMLDQYKNDIKNDFMDLTNADISIYYFVCKDNNLEECDVITDSEVSKYEYKKSSCKNGSTITYNNGEVLVEAKNKDICYVYFKGDIYDNQ